VRLIALAITLMLGLLAPLAGEAQPAPMARVGIVAGQPSSDLLPSLDQFRQELRKLGWIEGQNISVLELLSAEGRNERLPELAARALKADPRALVPVIRFRLVSNVAAIEPEKLKTAIEKYKERKLLVTVLEALRTAALLKNQLGDLGFKGVAADIVLTVPPAVNVEFLKDPPPLDV
jgi:hypothetical protein